MKHACKVTVLDKKCFQDLQGKYLADPQSGPCPCFEVGQTFLFERENGMMIACCNDGTRPVVFKLERIDIPETDEERMWLEAQDFSNSAEEAYTGA